MIGATEPQASAISGPYLQDRAPWGVREMLLVLGVIMVALVAIFTALAYLLRTLDISASGAEADIVGGPIELGGQILLDLIAVGAAAAFSLGKFRLPGAAWGLVRQRRFNPGLIAATVGGCYATLIIYSLVIKVLRLDAFLPNSNTPTGLLEHRAVVPLTVVFIVVIAPVCEEMFFRGFLLHGLWARFGFWPAAVISGGFFGAIHFTGVDSVGIVLPFATIGVLFALLVRRTGSLWNSIVAHMVFNGVSITASLLAGAAVMR